jgi:hypothetical protein
MGKVSIGDVIDIIPKPISTIYHIYHIYILYIYISIHIKIDHPMFKSKIRSLSGPFLGWTP